MTNQEITKYVRDWFARADEDLDVAQLILDEDRPYNPACFHAQQAAEKYLKGFLAHHEKHVRKIHDLNALLQECVKIDQSFENLQDSARFLSRFYVESRYPDDYIEFTREDAEKGLDAALRIKEFALEKITSQQKGGFGIIGIIIIIAAVAILGGGYFIFFHKACELVSPPKMGQSDPNVVERNGKLYLCRTYFERLTLSPLPSSQTTQEIQQPVPPAPSSELDISTWKTYRNEKYGFEFRYPAGWSLNAEGQDKISTPGGGEELNVEAKSANDRLTVSVVSAIEAPVYIYPIDNAKKVIIAGKEGLIAVRKINGDSAASFVIFSVTNGEFRYDLRFYDVIELSDIEQHILSTFKFIPSTSLPDGQASSGQVK